MTLVIGLTGGIATGKSTVAKMFLEDGIPVIDSDKIAKSLFSKDQPIYQKIIDTFGEAVLAPDKTINRNKLGEIIFKDEVMRDKLNKIVHPQVKKIIKTDIEHYKQLDTPIIVVDVPLLFESKFHTIMDKTIVVTARKKDQIERVMKRDQIDETYAKQKVEAQFPLSKKRELADYEIDNSKSILDTKKRFERILKKLKQTN